MADIAPTLTIPAGQRQAVVALAQMGPESYESLASQLDSALPSRSAVGLVSQLRPSGGDDNALWVRAVMTLVGLRILIDQQGLTSRDVASSISSEALRQRLIDTSRVATLAARLDRLLAIRSIVLTSKAFDLSTEYEHPFADVRILTDIRTLFETRGENATASAAAVVVHVLKLKDTAGNEYYTSVSEAGLRMLQAAITRALLKDHELRRLLERAEVQCLVEEPQSNLRGDSE